MFDFCIFRFIREKLDCEQSLIASSCGEPVGDLYIALMKASIKKEKCFVPRVHHQTKRKYNLPKFVFI